MELIKKNIHMDRVRTDAVSQITLEDDMNIPENKPDVSSLNLEKGEVVIEEVRPGNDMVMVKGTLNFCVLYQTAEEGSSLVPLEGRIFFDEKMNMNGVTSSDIVEVDGMVEDLTVGLINSRKLSIQALLTLQARVEELYDEEAPIGIRGDEVAEYRKFPLTLAQIAISKNDIFRIKEEMTLPASYPNLFQILWHTVSLGDVEFKVMEEKLMLQGDVHLFLLYEGEGEDHPVRAFETTVPFGGVLECHGCREGMVPDIRYKLGQQEIAVRPDFDGEERAIGLELAIDLSIRIYEEEEVEILSDIYGVTKEVCTANRRTNLRRLLSKVTGKTKVTERIRIENKSAGILQLLHSEGRVSLDRREVVENGIFLQGSLQVKVMYITGSDDTPYAGCSAVVPYQYTLEVPGIAPEDLGSVQCGAEQLQVSILDGEEMDVKAVLSFTTTVFQNVPMDLIDQVTVSELDAEKMGSLPGMVIYVVKEGDNLWNIGKKYYVPVENLRTVNEIAGSELKPGQKLLIVKGN